MKHRIRKIIAILLTIAMMAACMPASALASGGYDAFSSTWTECRMLCSIVPIDENNLYDGLLRDKMYLSGKQTSVDLYLYLVSEENFEYDYSTLEPVTVEGFDIYLSFIA